MLWAVVGRDVMTLGTNPSAHTQASPDHLRAEQPIAVTVLVTLIGVTVVVPQSFPRRPQCVLLFAPSPSDGFGIPRHVVLESARC